MEKAFLWRRDRVRQHSTVDQRSNREKNDKGESIDKKKTTTASVSLGVYAFLSKVTRRARMSTGWLFGEEEE